LIRTLSLLVLFGWTRLATAQELVQTVRSLPALSPGAVIDVVQADRQIVPGRVISVSTTGLDIETADGVRRFPATEVAEIWRFERHSLRKPLLIGSAVGVLLAAALQAGQGDCRDPNSPCATDGPVTAADYAVGAVFCAGVGAAISMIGHRTRSAVRRVTRPADMSRWWVLGAPVVGGIDGAVVAALVAAPYCVARYDDDEHQDRCGGTAAGVGAAIGGTLYTVFAWRATRSHVVYDAAAPPHQPKSNAAVEPIIARRGFGVRYLRRF
jgi:hypothetical protein